MVICFVETIVKPAYTASGANNSITIMHMVACIQQRVGQILLQVVQHQKQEQASECCRTVEKCSEHGDLFC